MRARASARVCASPAAFSTSVRRAVGELRQFRTELFQLVFGLFQLRVGLDERLAFAVLGVCSLARLRFLVLELFGFALPRLPQIVFLFLAFALDGRSHWARSVFLSRQNSAFWHISRCDVDLVQTGQLGAFEFGGVAEFAKPVDLACELAANASERFLHVQAKRRDPLDNGFDRGHCGSRTQFHFARPRGFFLLRIRFGAAQSGLFATVVELLLELFHGGLGAAFFVVANGQEISRSKPMG